MNRSIAECDSELITDQYHSNVGTQSRAELKNDGNKRGLLCYKLNLRTNFAKITRVAGPKLCAPGEGTDTFENQGVPAAYIYMRLLLHAFSL